MWTQVAANLEAGAGGGEGRSVQAAETTSAVCVLEVSRAGVGQESLGHREGTVEDPDGRLNRRQRSLSSFSPMSCDQIIIRKNHSG